MQTHGVVFRSFALLLAVLIGSHSNTGTVLAHRMRTDGNLRAQSAIDKLQFSWDTVPLYQQLCNPNATLGQAFPKERLEFLATHYPLITLEHCQGYYSFTQNGSHYRIEDYFVSASNELKAVNPNVTVLFYVSSVKGEAYYRWCSEGFQEHPSWRVVNENNDVCTSDAGHMLPQCRVYLWDQRQTAVQNYWASLCANLTNRSDSSLDGCSIDTASTCLVSEKETTRFETGRENAVSLAQELAGVNYIVGAVNAAAKDKVQLGHMYTFSASKKSLDWLNEMKEANMIAEAHAQTAVGGKRDHVNASLAAFLIGAYEKSYFAFSTSPGAGYHPFCDGTAPTWCYGMGWIDEFSKPLGKPLSDAVVSRGGMHYERKFASGTNVTLDLEENSCEILWADGSATICRKI